MSCFSGEDGAGEGGAGEGGAGEGGAGDAQLSNKLPAKIATNKANNIFFIYFSSFV
jgi:hypothetical protein